MLQCTVYRSGKRTDTYLYLSDALDFDELPQALRAAFGEPTAVMSLELGPDTRLAHADPAEVLLALQDPGYYLQLPPKLSVEDEITRRFS